MSKARVLVCDDEMLIRLWLEEHLREQGYSAQGVPDGASLLGALESEPTDLVLLDLRLPDGSGLDLLPRIRELDPSLPVIMITAYGEVETAVAAVRAGAHHFLEKPIELPELLLLIEQALESRLLRQELEQYRDGYRWQFSDVVLVGRSYAMRKIVELITRLALKGSPANVLLRGESGTGKDVVARAIHARGPRQTHPFISVNCTALPENLVESELFGHEAGAFTDAREQKRGLFELADRGTIFLDEIGDMSKSIQAKLLHFLEAHTLRRVGGVRDHAVDVHVITATNRDLEAAVAHGDFREDLFYRLNVGPVSLPPLRERPEDIAPLALHFVGVLSRELRLPDRHISPDALRALERYEWPGNARELRNALERILLLEDADVIELSHLPPQIRSAPHETERTFVLPPSGLSLDELERELICQALERTGGNKTGAARLLGLSRDTLRYRLEKHGIDRRPGVLIVEEAPAERLGSDGDAGTGS
ncbi:MAG: sigma-54-dependent Fis family transcriptional regulator [Gemmatimonadetes bacterium]|nr:sigma-54-dependent Fis family transcriptional regulator [Gemmatimonadota bacterium]